MRNTIITTILASCLATSAMAQVPKTQVAGSPLVAQWQPSSPAGGVIIGQFLKELEGFDGVGGFRNMFPTDGAQINGNLVDPRTASDFQYDIQEDSQSIGGNGPCVPFCKLGQPWFDGNSTLFVPAWDKAKGQPGSITFPGVWKMQVDPISGFPSLIYLLAPNGGLGGDQPVAVTKGADGRIYVVFLRNGNLKSIDNPGVDPSLGTQTVRSVGTTVNGRPSRGIVVVGNDIYVATTDGLDKFTNVSACGTPNGTCNAQPVNIGFPRGTPVVGLAVHGGYIYMSINGLGGVYRYNVATGTTQLVANGFAFIGGQLNGLFFDDVGNLYVGDDTSDGRLTRTGRWWRVLASDLATLPQ